MFPDVWFLPCNETPFLNRNHPVFLAIKDRVVDCDEGRIQLAHFGWVTPASCCKTKTEAEEELFHHYEIMWLDRGLIRPQSRSTLAAYCKHGKITIGRELPWFDLNSILYEDRPEAVIDVEAFMRP